MESDHQPLRQLAARLGIIDEYFDLAGHVRVTTDETRRALLAGLGLDVHTDQSARDYLAELNEAADAELIPPVLVVEQGDSALAHLTLHAPSSRARGGPWRLEVVLESGERSVTEGPWRGDAALSLALPPNLSLGYHEVRVALSAGGEAWSNEQTLIVVPPRCVAPAELLGETPSFGLIANLYTVRSNTNWGVGDFTDLAALGTWGAGVGADFVGLNPLHALLNRGDDISPYSPVSRLFRNPIYIDVARVPELQHAPELRDHLASAPFRSEIDALRETPAVRYDQVMAVKRLVLDALYRVFIERVRGSGDARDREYAAYVATVEPELGKFALWMTIAEDTSLAGGNDWRRWPAELRDPSSAAVARLAVERAKRVDFHRWIQFEADRQLGEAAKTARAAGMRIGVYQDLAIGTSPAGADAWAFAPLFAQRTSIGAPPDAYAVNGQNWGLPPLDPRAMKRDRYRYVTRVLRSAFRHAGAVRIDHVMGLFRLFWIPDGMHASDGAYVRYPASDLLGIVALESVRQNALVVGEDLGTVAADVPPALQKWSVLSSKVLFFERESNGDFKASHTYPKLALATANTHDMPTITGFWEARDIDVRRALGVLTTEEEADWARIDRERERHALLELLAREGIIANAWTPISPAELRAAVYAFLWRTPAALAGIALDDLAGEIEQVNVPGVGPDKYSSWTRKMRRALETIIAGDELAAILRRDGRAIGGDGDGGPGR